MSNKQIRSINEIGKFNLIKEITKKFKPQQKSTHLSIGDDAAAIQFKDELTLVSTELFLEGVHFNLEYQPLKHLGYKVISVSIGDIYAMNATPSQVTVSIGISNKFSVEAIDLLYEGIHQACETYGIDLIGGDTKPSLTGLVISVTAIGHVTSGKIVKRNGAKVNDLICVSGNLGAAYMGLKVLEREGKLFREDPNFQPDLEPYQYVVGRHLKPDARRQIKDLLDELGIVPTSMIDITDGLASELLHLCAQSKTGCKIFENKIPIDEETLKTAEEFNISPLQCALNGGEDNELLFTIPMEMLNTLVGKPEISIIGHMLTADQGKNIITEGGSEIELQAPGWK